MAKNTAVNSKEATAETAREDTARDYRDTLLLPKTDFAMKAQLSKLEPRLLAFWKDMALYEKLREKSKGREKFILHDGPPYANGDIHLGTSLNKILKDFIVRSQQMMGKDAPYVPGWDCHGLPIEWKVEENYRAQGIDKKTVSPTKFRRACRDFAKKWIAAQSEQFQRLGIQGDWKNPYTTMSYDAEAIIVQEFLTFLMQGSLYQGSKPIMWSVVEQTALAEAEIEYLEHKSTTLWLAFPVIKGPRELKDCHMVIWTTTPWTIPANRAIAFSSSVTYGIYLVESTPEDSAVEKGTRLVLADVLADSLQKAASLTLKRLAKAPPLQDTVCAHPLKEQGFDHDVPLYSADFVSAQAGTGLVHIAPSHGTDDYALAIKENIPVPTLMDTTSQFHDSVPLVGGCRVFNADGTTGNANGVMLTALQGTKYLLAQGRYRHEYPHSWRSKAPLIFLNTPQWFISMKHNNLRQLALKAIDQVTWYPSHARNRIKSMVETRPDWVVSRQRFWGVPLTLFVHKKTGKPLQDAKVNARILAAIKKEGADAWFTHDAQDFLGPHHAIHDYHKVTDILDVWFDSGSSHAFVLEQNADLKSPADLYVEGSDQHRGWFQSSLLTSCGTRGHAPYKATITHGFYVDAKGRKMSKSMRNSLAPQKIIDQYGADILRLWVAHTDYMNDLHMSDTVLRHSVESYRKIRNTLRFLLGNLHGFDDKEAIKPENMPELERLVLHYLHQLGDRIAKAHACYDFKTVHQLLFNFMTNDLSSFYFDIRKDCLYCDTQDSPTRRACRTVLHQLFNHLTLWLSPVLCFTTEEAWQSRFGAAKTSVHLQTMPENMPWQAPDLEKKWAKIRTLRKVVTGILEVERAEKRLGSSLEAAPILYIRDKELRALAHTVDMAEICITSQLQISEKTPPPNALSLPDVNGVAVVVERAKGKKCQRSWKILPTVGTVPKHPNLSPRDAKAVDSFDQRHA